MRKRQEFVGEDWSQVMEQVKIEMGENALIVEQKEENVGIFGIGNKKRWRMIAERGEKPEKQKTKKKKLSELRKEHQKKGRLFNRTIDEPIVPTFIKDLSNSPAACPVFRKNVGQSLRSGVVMKNPLSNRRALPVRQEIRTEMKEPRAGELDELKKSIEEMKSKMDEMLSATRRDVTVGYPEALGELFISLLKEEVDKDLAEKLMRDLKKKIPRETWTDEILVRKTAHTWFREKISLRNRFPETGSKPRMVAFVGPTGVGKTSTLVKLGSNKVLMESQKCSFFTFDNYRIAAVEQLKTYANIIGAPTAAIKDIREIPGHMESHIDSDWIFIDTAGRSPRNMQKIIELSAFLEEIGKPVETVLLLSATTRYRDMKQIMMNFEETGFSRVIFTKLDETTSMGPLLSMAINGKRPIPYITNGQNVPNDIEPLNVDKLIRNVLKD